jgi:hypothetical protein
VAVRWFKHYADARNNPKFTYILKILGEAGYSRAFQLFEIIAQRGGKADDFFRPEINLQEPCTDFSWLAKELGISTSNLRKTLKIFAKARLIDPEVFRRNIINVPQMSEYLDEWTGRKQRSSSRAMADSISNSSQHETGERNGLVSTNSRPTPELLPNGTGAARTRVRESESQ